MDLITTNILRQYKNGMSFNEMSNLNGMSPSKLRMVLRPYLDDGTITLRNAPFNKRKLTDEERRGIAEDYFVGRMKCYDLYEKWHINPVHLFQVRTEYQHLYTDTVRRQVWSAEEYEQMAEDYYVAGLSRREMMEKWGIKSNTTFDTLGKMFAGKYGKKKVGRKNGDKW